MFFLWWLPIWVLGPAVADVASVSVKAATIAVAIIQTIIGLAGVLIIGKQAAVIIRKTSYKKAPRILWHSFWSGKLDIPA